MAARDLEIYFDTCDVRSLVLFVYIAGGSTPA